MKHIYKFLFAFLLLPNLVLAQQNLVPNPSFEDTTHCPFGAEDIDAALGWYAASGSPDYFHPCANSTTPQVGIPQNTAGYQLPYLGDAYAGLITHATSSPNIREHLGILLQQPLNIGTEYFISAFISKGDASSVAWNNDCASNNFGFRFSTARYDEFVFTSSPVDNFSHINNDNVIKDSINWVQISGSFIADSAYTYLRLGNFYDTTNTIVSPCVGDAYYFIDNVCVSTSASTCEVTVGLPNYHLATVQLYPNPATTKLALKNLFGANTYSIVNATGKSVKDGEVNGPGNLVDISALPNGLYFFRLNNNYTYRFIISR